MFVESGERLGFIIYGKGFVVLVVDVNEDLLFEIYVGSDLILNVFYICKFG